MTVERTHTTATARTALSRQKATSIHEIAFWHCSHTGLRMSLGGFTVLKHPQDVQRIGAFAVVDSRVGK
jgi:hypothetical protein